MKLILGDSVKEIPKLESDSIDSCVTDPPYGLKFMGKKWDYNVPTVELWREVLRVLKPGGYLLSFGGTRTYHRMVCNIEDAGFEIRDQIQWLYGSGFPKSLDVSKAIDKAAGAERKVTGIKPGHEKYAGKTKNGSQQWERPSLNDPKWQIKYHQQTAASTSQAKQWQGFGTALKPAHEPIVLARKPLSEKTVAKNVLKWGTGGLNIDGCRVGYQSNIDKALATPQGKVTSKKPKDGYVKAAGIKSERHEIERPPLQGRFPANLLLDEQAAEMLDRQSGLSISINAMRGTMGRYDPAVTPDIKKRKHYSNSIRGHADSGGASRFFYCAKASKSERGEGNNHPTVKPLKLMSYLVRLITPPKGKVLDPFMGSGTTGLASEGFEFIGIESEKDSFEICKQRLITKTDATANPDPD